MPTDPLLQARALVLHDLVTQGLDGPARVSLVEDAVAARRWWVEQWPEGAAYVAGQVAQDVQDRLADERSRWPRCAVHDPETLEVDPELGADPRWVCPHGCGDVAPLGALPPLPTSG